MLDASSTFPSLIYRLTIRPTPNFTTTPNKNMVIAIAYSLFDLKLIKTASEIPNAARDNMAIGNASGKNQPFSATRFCINKRYRIVLIVKPANNAESLYLFISSSGEIVDHTTINAPIGYNDQLMVRSIEKFIIKQAKEANKTKEVMIKNDLPL
jgi:hypothetical protein